MTLVIAYVDNDYSYMASDTLGANSVSSAIYQNKKIFCKGDMLIGGAGSYKALQLIEKQFELPASDGKSADEYMYGPFIDGLTAFLLEHNMLKLSDNLISSYSSSLMFIYQKEIYKFQADLALMQPVVNFATIGTGGDYAHGVLSALAGQKNNIENKLSLAVLLTAEYILSVGGPVEMLKI